MLGGVLRVFEWVMKRRGVKKMKNLGPSRNQSEPTSIDRGLFLSIEDQCRKQTDSTSIDRGMFLSIEQFFSILYR
jgi:hypothetical protein